MVPIGCFGIILEKRSLERTDSMCGVWGRTSAFLVAGPRCWNSLPPESFYPFGWLTGLIQSPA